MGLKASIIVIANNPRKKVTNWITIRVPACDWLNSVENFPSNAGKHRIYFRKLDQACFKNRCAIKRLPWIDKEAGG